NQDPGGEEGKADRRDAVGPQDIKSVRAHRPASRAAILRIDETRRRQISVRMAIRCRVKNSSVKPSAQISSGHSIDGWMVGPSRRITDAGWCSVFHQSTENLMIGMLTKPTSVTIAAARALRPGSSSARVSAMMPRYIRKSTKTEVRRASHTHQVPHIGLPQIEPVASASSVKTAPIGAADFTETSASGWRQTSVPSDDSAMIE